VSRTSSVAIITALVLSAAACSHRNYDSAKPQDTAPQPRYLTLSVTNDNFYDMNVYVVSGALGTRLGTVTGNSRTRFTVRQNLFPTGQVRFVALPIGGFGRGASDNISVFPGQSVEFRIGSNLALTTALIRR
jgi:hypothetical protein